MLKVRNIARRGRPLPEQDQENETRTCDRLANSQVIISSNWR